MGGKAPQAKRCTALLRLGGLPPPFCFACDARVALEPVHRSALGVALLCNARPLPVRRSALGPGLRGASAPLLHCEAMQPPVRPVRPVRPVKLAPVRSSCPSLTDFTLQAQGRALQRQGLRDLFQWGQGFHNPFNGVFPSVFSQLLK